MISYFQTSLSTSTCATTSRLLLAAANVAKVVADTGMNVDANGGDGLDDSVSVVFERGVSGEMGPITGCALPDTFAARPCTARCSSTFQLN